MLIMISGLGCLFMGWLCCSLVCFLVGLACLVCWFMLR